MRYTNQHLPFTFDSPSLILHDYLEDWISAERLPLTYKLRHIV